MPKIRNIIAFILLIALVWHFYGETFQHSGFTGVVDEIRSDVHSIQENPTVNQVIHTISQEIQLLVDKLGDDRNDTNFAIETPKLETPTEQPFSIHNIELGDHRKAIEEQVGSPQRSSINEYGVDWVAYHENYQNFFMVAYNDQDQVVGLYTNQDLLVSKQGISIDSPKEKVLETLDDPLQSIRKGFIQYQIQQTDEYHTFDLNNSYVTIFYDKHKNNTVTAIQIISDQLEQQKEDFFGEPSNELKEGFEYQLFDLTNAARVKHGLSVLSWDDTVRNTARNHSSDMAENNYFSHTNPDGQSPFDRMAEDEIAFRMAGENLAAGQTSSIFAHEGLMNSLGHRENILKSDYRALGVGVAFNSESKPYFTEMFLTR